MIYFLRRRPECCIERVERSSQHDWWVERWGGWNDWVCQKVAWFESMSKLLLRHSMCDQVFVSPESECSQSLNDRDLDSNFVGNTADMVGYITTCNHQVCLVDLDYAGLCSRGNLVKSFLERHPNITKVVVDLYSSKNQFVMLDSADIIRDPS